MISNLTEMIYYEHAAGTRKIVDVNHIIVIANSSLSDDVQVEKVQALQDSSTHKVAIYISLHFTRSKVEWKLC